MGRQQPPWLWIPSDDVEPDDDVIAVILGPGNRRATLMLVDMPPESPMHQVKIFSESAVKGEAAHPENLLIYIKRAGYWNLKNTHRLSDFIDMMYMILHAQVWEPSG